MSRETQALRLCCSWILKGDKNCKEWESGTQTQIKTLLTVVNISSQPRLKMEPGNSICIVSHGW